MLKRYKQAFPIGGGCMAMRTPRISFPLKLAPSPASTLNFHLSRFSIICDKATTDCAPLGEVRDHIAGLSSCDDDTKSLPQFIRMTVGPARHNAMRPRLSTCEGPWHEAFAERKAERRTSRAYSVALTLGTLYMAALRRITQRISKKS